MTHERDIRDPALDALLRTHLHETPPTAVDAAIVAAAHRAVEATPRARSARATQAWRWWMPLAAAAVIGVVVIGIVPVAPTLVDAPPPPSEVTAALPAAPMPKTIAAPPPAPQLGAARELADRGAVVSRGTDAHTAVAERSMAPSVSAAPAPAVDANAPATASRNDAALADQRAKQATRTSSPDEWIAHLRKLRNDGRMAEAARALTDFRAAFSDADIRLPEDLRAWAKTVR